MPSIILIGPTRAGKSTIVKLLTEKTALPGRSCYQTNLADLAYLGYNETLSNEISTQQGEKALHAYMARFYPALVQQLLERPGEAVIELEAEFISYAEPELTAKLQEVLQPFPEVVLLLPSPDLKKSVRILRQREEAEFEAANAFNDFFVDHPSNKILARHTFYTRNNSPEHTATEIIGSLRLADTRSKVSPVVLIGPMCTGKSTLGVILARKLGLNQISLDMVRWEYYKEIGYDYAVAGEKYKQGGLRGLYDYWQPFHAHAVKRVLEDYPTSVIDFGAGHSVYTDQNLLDQVKATLTPFENILLILPSPDVAETKRTLRQRGYNLLKSIYDLHEEFNRSGNFEKIARQTVYTDGKTPDQVASEILKMHETLS